MKRVNFELSEEIDMVCPCCGGKHPKLKQFTIGDGLVITEDKNKAKLRKIFNKYQ